MLLCLVGAGSAFLEARWALAGSEASPPRTTPPPVVQETQYLVYTMLTKTVYGVTQSIREPLSNYPVAQVVVGLICFLGSSILVYLSQPYKEKK